MDWNAVVLLVAVVMSGALTARLPEDSAELLLDSAELDVEEPAENICDVTVPVSIYCLCDSLLVDDATTANCWIFNMTLETDPIWTLFSTQPNLTELKLNLRPEGRLTFIPNRALRQLPKLTKIHIFYAEIQTIFPDAFAGVPDLLELNLANNQIRRISENSFQSLQHLRSLSLSENQIDALQRGVFAGLRKLEVLRLAMNNISLVQDGVFVDLHHLHELDLSNNNVAIVTSETLLGLESLQTLILQNNILEILGDNTFKYAPLIEHLDLKSNRLQVVREAAFMDLENLQYLNLQDNEIRHIGDLTFHESVRINYLNLRNNKLESVSHTALKPLWKNLLQPTTALSLEGNPLQCSCDLQWLRDLHLATKSSKIQDSISRSTCINRKASKTLLQAVQSMLCHETTTTSFTTASTSATTTELATTKSIATTERLVMLMEAAVAEPKNLQKHPKTEDDFLQKDTVALPEPTAVTEKHSAGNSASTKSAAYSVIILISAAVFRSSIN